MCQDATMAADTALATVPSTDAGPQGSGHSLQGWCPQRSGHSLRDSAGHDWAPSSGWNERPISMTTQSSFHRSSHFPQTALHSSVLSDTYLRYILYRISISLIFYLIWRFNMDQLNTLDCYKLWTSMYYLRLRLRVSEYRSYCIFKCKEGRWRVCLCIWVQIDMLTMVTFLSCVWVFFFFSTKCLKRNIVWINP